MKWVNTLSANPTKWSNTLKQFVGFYDHSLDNTIAQETSFEKKNIYSNLCKRFLIYLFYF